MSSESNKHKRKYRNRDNDDDETNDSKTRKDDRNYEYKKSRRDNNESSEHHHHRSHYNHREERRRESRDFSDEKRRRERETGREDKSKKSNNDEQPKEIQGQSRPSWDNNKVKRHAEMIQERKFLWKGGRSAAPAKIDESESAEEQQPSQTTGNCEKKLENKWTSIIAVTAKDTQQMDKFQRLMGLKKTGPATATSKEDSKAEDDHQGKSVTASSDPLGVGNDEMENERRRQQDLQQGLDKQFELARHAHHSARGRGLGSF